MVRLNLNYFTPVRSALHDKGQSFPAFLQSWAKCPVSPQLQQVMNDRRPSPLCRLCCDALARELLLSFVADSSVSSFPIRSKSSLMSPVVVSTVVTASVPSLVVIAVVVGVASLSTTDDFQILCELHPAFGLLFPSSLEFDLV